MQEVNTVVAPFKFLHLKSLMINLIGFNGAFSPANDYLSLAYFIDVSPVLETFTLIVSKFSCVSFLEFNAANISIIYSGTISSSMLYLFLCRYHRFAWSMM
mgnify:CR=1 FL=1